jgi:hypothetical protein
MLLSFNSYAQKMEEAVSITVPCYNTTALFKSLKESFKEMPLLTGRASDEAKSILSFWMNPIDNSWSIIATNKDLSCVIGIGTNFNLLNYKTGKEV